MHPSQHSSGRTGCSAHQTATMPYTHNLASTYVCMSARCLLTLILSEANHRRQTVFIASACLMLKEHSEYLLNRHGTSSQTNSRQTWQATKQQRKEGYQMRQVFPVHINQRLIVLNSCASSFFMQQTDERRCDAKPGSDAAVRRRLSVRVTLQSAANPVMVHPTKNLSPRGRPSLGNWDHKSGDEKPSDKQQHN